MVVQIFAGKLFCFTKLKEPVAPVQVPVEVIDNGGDIMVAYDPVVLNWEALQVPLAQGRPRSWDPRYKDAESLRNHPVKFVPRYIPSEYR